MEFNYDVKEKENCWYKNVCTKKENCSSDITCPRHFKMCYLVHMATMKGKQKYTIQLYPDDVDYNSFVRLKEIQKNIEQFVNDGKNLLIYSKGTGNGKTEWAKKFILSWFGEIWHKTDFKCRGLFISMPQLMQAMKENISKENEYFQYVNQEIANADLVIWDELNYKDMTQYEQEYMLNIISQRVGIGKSNIYTTNYDLQTIEKKLGNRLASRIVGCSELIELKGSDKRGGK